MDILEVVEFLGGHFNLAQNLPQQSRPYDVMQRDRGWWSVRMRKPYMAAFLSSLIVAGSLKPFDNFFGRYTRQPWHSIYAVIRCTLTLVFFAIISPSDISSRQSSVASCTFLRASSIVLP